MTDDIEERLAVSPRAMFLDHCANGRLAYQVARDGRPVFYPRLAQPGSGDTGLEWRVSSGLGVVYASTTVRPRGEQPFNVAMIELDEGFRLMSAVVDVDPDAVVVGARVQVAMRTLGDAPALPVFTLLEDPDA